jgi:hypothetical protein
MVVPDASRSRHVAFLKQSCGFSTQVRNGICCRKAIPTIKATLWRQAVQIIFALQPIKQR